jgi:hypothetical protein
MFRKLWNRCTEKKADHREVCPIIFVRRTQGGETYERHLSKFSKRGRKKKTHIFARKPIFVRTEQSRGYIARFWINFGMQRNWEFDEERRSENEAWFLCSI